MVTKRTIKKNLSVRDTIGLNLLINFYQLVNSRIKAIIVDTICYCDDIGNYALTDLIREDHSILL